MINKHKGTIFHGLVLGILLMLIVFWKMGFFAPELEEGLDMSDPIKGLNSISLQGRDGVEFLLMEHLPTRCTRAYFRVDGDVYYADICPKDLTQAEIEELNPLMQFPFPFEGLVYYYGISKQGIQNRTYMFLEEYLLPASRIIKFIES
ncbi:MAG: hypothetical protein GOU99_02995 [Candidatus Altiarchaeota archaeon]|nr:hypothetical protein [Candidatus Altiarchaeota archaeon]